jgi:hypothetical protein
MRKSPFGGLGSQLLPRPAGAKAASARPAVRCLIILRPCLPSAIDSLAVSPLWSSYFAFKTRMGLPSRKASAFSRL